MDRRMLQNQDSWVRTDLALEAAENLHARQGPIPGLEVTEDRRNGALVTRVDIQTDEAGRLAGKARGHYVTIEAQDLRRRDRQFSKKVSRILTQELENLLNLPRQATVFVVGLGNWHATPDALGPRVISKLLVTRHLREHVPADLKGRLRSVCALAPGVLGLTGIETGEIIKGIVDRISPDVVLAVDALASQSIERILTTIQITNTGIHPGSGIADGRVGITPDTLGIPVVALGVPTVVSAVTIAQDTVDILIQNLRQRESLYQLLGDMGGKDKRLLLQEVLRPSVGDLMVTPKEIDAHIEDMAQVVAAAINQALHKGVDLENMMDYLM